MLLYYVERDVLAAGGLEQIDNEELLIAFFTALVEFFFTPFISFFEFIESVFTTGVVLENRLGSGAGAYQLFVRGGSIADSNATVSFALDNLKPEVEYVVIIGYYESFYEQFDGEVDVTPTDLEAFGFGSFTLEEGIDSRLTIRVDQPLGTTETNLETFLGVAPGFLNVASNLGLQPPQFLVTFGQDLETGLNEIDDPLATEPEPLP